MLFLRFSYGFPMVFLGLKLQENRKKTGRKPEENRKKTGRKPKENQKKTKRKPKKTEENQKKRKPPPLLFKLNGNWAERIAVMRLRVLTCRCSSESEELRGKCRVWSGTLSHVMLWRSSPQMHHQLFVIWHSSSKYRGVTKLLTQIVKVGISVLFFRLCVI